LSSWKRDVLAIADPLLPDSKATEFQASERAVCEVGSTSASLIREKSGIKRKDLAQEIEETD
jgi:hypothetical protein